MQQVKSGIERGELCAISSLITVTSLPLAISHMTISESVRIMKGPWQDAGQMAGYERVRCGGLERSLPP